MATVETLEIVSFSVGADRFAVEARQIEALLDEAPQAMVAIETLLGLPIAAATPRRCLRVEKYSVGVGDPVDLRSLPVDSLYPLPELVASRIQISGVRALALEAHGAMPLLDLRALLARHDRLA